MTYRRPAPRRFNATEQIIIRDLQATGRKMGMSNLRVNKHQDLMNPDADPSAEIVFDRGGRRYVVRCQNYEHRLDNFRAAQRCISLLYQALEEYGATREAVALDETFDRLFLAFAATPDDTVLMRGARPIAMWGQVKWAVYTQSPVMRAVAPRTLYGLAAVNLTHIFCQKGGSKMGLTTSAVTVQKNWNETRDR